MKYLLTILTFSFFTFSFAQKVKNLKVGPSYDTISLPFIDDFYDDYSSIDTTLWSAEGDGFKNNGFPVASPSNGVITLDGKQSDGVPYIFVDYEPTITPEYSDSIDYLVSKAIDLSSVNSSSQLGLSFFWQMGGKSTTNAPELEEGDSLHLYFLKRDSTWEKVWPLAGDTSEISATSPGDPFKYAFLSITDSISFFHQGFRMKFDTYGSATGPYDIWSIDYVYLDTNRITDSRLLDFAFNKRPTTILEGYTSAPISHVVFKGESAIADSVFSSMINISSNGSLFLEDTAFGNVTETYRNIKIDTVKAINQNQFLGVDQETEVIWNPIKANIISGIAAANDGSPINLQIKFINKTPDLIPHNDTIYGNTYLNNYYAYDDGTAESGMGIFNYGQLAIQYNNYKEDTLEYIDIYFPKMEFNLEYTAINLKVWQTLDGVDGESETKVIQTNAAIVLYKDGLNQFYHYQLVTPIILEPGTFYIGFEQNIQTRIYIGWDKSLDHSDKVFFQNSTGVWESYQDSDIFAFGSPMIRPRFGDPDNIVGIVETTVDPIIQLFPNPTTDQLHITGNVREAQVWSITGELISTYRLNSRDIETINTAALTSGIYLLKVSGDGFSNVQRFVKE